MLCLGVSALVPSKSGPNLVANVLKVFFLKPLPSFHDDQAMTENIEIRVSYRYLKEHPWVVQGITGFLSAYFMEKPGFQVQKHFDELETGIHVWVCDIPPNMKIRMLLRRLKEDIPPCQYQQLETDAAARPQYLIDSLDNETK